MFSFAKWGEQPYLTGLFWKLKNLPICLDPCTISWGTQEFSIFLPFLIPDLVFIYFLGYLFPTILIPHLVIQTTWILHTFSIFVSFHIPPYLKTDAAHVFLGKNPHIPTFRSKWSSPSHSLSFKEWRLCPPLAGHHCPWYSSSDVLSMLSLTVMMTINIIP